eukprot:SAG22_NODE_1989_length_3201_cov_1.728240_2_plen_194_part_00
MRSVRLADHSASSCGPLPSKAQPSDHLPLVAEFALLPEGSAPAAEAEVEAAVVALGRPVAGRLAALDAKVAALAALEVRLLKLEGEQWNRKERQRNTRKGSDQAAVAAAAAAAAPPPPPAAAGAVGLFEDSGLLAAATAKLQEVEAGLPTLVAATPADAAQAERRTRVLRELLEASQAVAAAVQLALDSETVA